MTLSLTVGGWDGLGGCLSVVECDHVTGRWTWRQTWPWRLGLSHWPTTQMEKLSWQDINLSLRKNWHFRDEALHCYSQIDVAYRLKTVLDRPQLLAFHIYLFCLLIKSIIKKRRQTLRNCLLFPWNNYLNLPGHKKRDFLGGNLTQLARDRQKCDYSTSSRIPCFDRFCPHKKAIKGPSQSSPKTRTQKKDNLDTKEK